MSGSIQTGTSSSGRTRPALGDDDGVEAGGARGRERAGDQRRARELDRRLRAAHAAAAPARQHRDDHAPTASAPSSLRSLTCSCSGENGVASRSSAPAARGSRPGALVDHQQHLRVARQRVGAQRADDLRGARPAEDHEVRAGVARRVQRARRSASRCTSTRPPSATRAIARVLGVDAGEQHARDRRAAAAASRIPRSRRRRRSPC